MDHFLQIIIAANGELKIQFIVDISFIVQKEPYHTHLY